MTEFERFIRDLKARIDQCIDPVDMIIAVRRAVDEAHAQITERIRKQETKA